MRILLSLALLLSVGCVRLTDPVYYSKSLSAPSSPEPGYALVFGTVVVEGGIFTPEALDLITLRQVAPKVDRPFHFVTSENLFRAFGPRYLKDGHFVILLTPGAYELHELRTSGFFTGSARWRSSEEASLASRFYITRPGIYDLGTWKIEAQGFNSHLVQMTTQNSPDRQRVLQEAIAGTSWEKQSGQWVKDVP